MWFPGRFADSLVADQLDNLSVSFLVENLQIRRGGVAANIAFGLGCLGLSPILVGSVGDDFQAYRSWLERHGVDTKSVQVSELYHTARFTCTTDLDANQIASFYPGAMVEARDIELQPIAERAGQLDLVVISPNDPEAMLRHTAECRDRGIAFVADPSQQLAFMGGREIRKLVDGAAYLFTNEYEAALIELKTGWSAADILDRVGVRITTRAANGSRIESADSHSIEVPAVKVTTITDPTGVGDAFRAGYIAGLAWELPAQRCAQIGSMLAALVIETTGTQEYRLDGDEFMGRFSDAYGLDAAAQLPLFTGALTD